MQRNGIVEVQRAEVVEQRTASHGGHIPLGAGVDGGDAGSGVGGGNAVGDAVHPGDGVSLAGLVTGGSGPLAQADASQQAAQPPTGDQPSILLHCAAAGPDVQAVNEGNEHESHCAAVHAVLHSRRHDRKSQHDVH